MFLVLHLASPAKRQAKSYILLVQMALATIQKYLKIEGSPINYVSTLEAINKKAELTKEDEEERKLYEKLKAKFDKQH